MQCYTRYAYCTTSSASLENMQLFSILKGLYVYKIQWKSEPKKRLETCFYIGKTDCQTGTHEGNADLQV